MRELSIEEGELVGGGVGPVGAVIGGISGGAAYAGSAIVTGSGSLGGFASGVAIGAASGFLLGPAGMSATQVTASTIVGAEVGFYSGMLGGAVENGVNAAGTNYGAGGTNYN